MKRLPTTTLITAALLVVLCPAAFSQVAGTSLYARAFEACVQKEDKFLRNQANGNRVLTVSYDDDLTRVLQSEVGDTKVEYLNERELAQKYLDTPKDKRGG